MNRKSERPSLRVWPSADQERLLKIVVSTGEQAEKLVKNWLNEDATSDLDNPEIAEFVPILYDKMLSGKYTDIDSDSPIYAQIKAMHLAFRALAVQQRQHWEPLLVELKTAGINPILIKGSSLLNGYYKSSAQRAMSDIDILVPIAQQAHAMSIITQAGWQEQRLSVDTKDSTLSHAIAFTKSSSPVSSVDLHSHALSNCFAQGLDDWFIDNTENAAFGDVVVKRMNPTALLAHTILHGVKSDKSGQTRWILDAKVIDARRGDEVNWPSLFEFADQFSLLYRLKHGLEYLHNNGYVKLPDSVHTRLAEYKPSWFEKFECNYIFKDREVENMGFFYRYTLLAQHLLYRAIRMDKLSRLPISLCRVCSHHIDGDNWRNVLRRIIFFRLPR